MAKRRIKHLYRFGARKREIRSFQRRYGRKKGKKVYGAVVGKIKRLRKRKYGKG